MVYNDALAFCKESGQFPGYSQLSARLTQLKKPEEKSWLKDVASVPLQQSVRQLKTAFKNFFDSCQGKRKGRKVGYPKFRKKANSQSAEFTRAGFSLKGDEVY